MNDKRRVKSVNFGQKYDTSLRLKRIDVVWIDAHSDDAKLTLREIKTENELFLVETVGFLVHESKSVIVVAQNAFDECPEDDSEFTYRHTLWIPKVLIKTRKELVERD